jgi:hypothetical protein
MDPPGLRDGIHLLLRRIYIVVRERFVSLSRGISTISMSRCIIGAGTPSKHRSLVTLSIAGWGTGVEWAIVVEHYNHDCLGSCGGEKVGRKNILGPTPVKSRRSMTSACWEPFFERPFPEDFAFSARTAESWDWDLRPGGRELGVGFLKQTWVIREI